MKSILYVGATLMIGASIYGFIDYRKTSHKKEFANMYKEKERDVPVTKVVTEKNSAATEEINSVAKQENEVTGKSVASVKKEVKKTAKQKTRKFKPELFSRGALDERYIKEETPKTKSEPSKTENKE